jgi:16S rRNA (cytidine1402-2'-O)-methyltransferase
LERLIACFGNRRACVARELTKLHEEVAHGSLQELAERFDGTVRGEVTLVVEGAGREARPASVEELDSEILTGFDAHESSKQLSMRLAKQSGLARKVVYGRILELREARGKGAPPRIKR